MGIIPERDSLQQRKEELYMPIKVQNDLPAKKIMEKENIFIMNETRAVTQNIRPLQIAILNLMPLKEDTEIQMMRSLSNTPLQLETTFLTTAQLYRQEHTGKPLKSVLSDL